MFPLPLRVALRGVAWRSIALSRALKRSPRNAARSRMEMGMLLLMLLPLVFFVEIIKYINVATLLSAVLIHEEIVLVSVQYCN